MNYNDKNKHERDCHIHFDADEHKYTLGGRVLKSVTTIVGEHFQQFDADYHAARMAPKLGMTAEEVKEMWRLKGEAAAALGTQMHADIEQFYLAAAERETGEENVSGGDVMPDGISGGRQPVDFPVSSDSAFALFKRFAEQYDLCPFRTEWAIYDEASGVAGTLDMLSYRDGVYTLYDWKRSNKILFCGKPDKENRWGKRAFAPIAHIHDTTYWHYALQQSIYRYILEKNYGITVASSNLVVLHPDYNKHYVVEVPYLKTEVRAMLTQK